jgi:hypothetical protein
MTQTDRPAQFGSARAARKQRAYDGVVASYIRDISERTTSATSSGVTAPTVATLAEARDSASSSGG